MIFTWIKRLLAVLGRTTHIDEPRLSVSIPLPLFTRIQPTMSQSFLALDRRIFTDKSTIGDLIDRETHSKLCYTLEDTCRKFKIPGETAIPSGRYKVIMAPFRGGPMCPKLLEVPFFEGIFCHGGNVASDTSGCILLGMRHDVDVLYDSKKALNDVVIPRILELLKRGDVYLDVFGGYSKDDWEKRNA